MLKTIEASEVRANLSEIMIEAYKNSTRFVLESDKIPMAVVIGYQDYLQLLEDKEDIEAMLEAAEAPESEKIDYDEYRKRRLSMRSRTASVSASLRRKIALLTRWCRLRDRESRTLSRVVGTLRHPKKPKSS